MNTNTKPELVTPKHISRLTCQCHLCHKKGEVGDRVQIERGDGTKVEVFEFRHLPIATLNIGWDAPQLAIAKLPDITCMKCYSRFRDQLDSASRGFLEDINHARSEQGKRPLELRNLPSVAGTLTWYWNKKQVAQKKTAVAASQIDTEKAKARTRAAGFIQKYKIIPDTTRVCAGCGKTHGSTSEPVLTDKGWFSSVTQVRWNKYLDNLSKESLAANCYCDACRDSHGAFVRYEDTLAAIRNYEDRAISRRLHQDSQKRKQSPPVRTGNKVGIAGIASNERSEKPRPRKLRVA